MWEARAGGLCGGVLVIAVPPCALANFELIDLGVPAFLRASHLRAKHGLRTPDALHLAAAQLTGCAHLWTNDTRLAGAAPAIAVDVVGVPQ